MTDLRERFRELEDLPVPDLWDRVADLAAEPGSPRNRRSRVGVAIAASVVVLLAIGVPLLLLGFGSDAEIDHDPVGAGWATVPTHSPWDMPVVDAVQMPGGGFAVLTANPSDLFWSPDGASWYDADAADQLPEFVPIDSDGEGGPTALAVIGDQLAFLDRSGVGVWWGDRQTGIWQFTALDPGEGPGQADLLTMAPSAGELLVIGQVRGPDVLEDPGFEIAVTNEYLAWLVDIADGAAARNSLPIAGPERAEPDTAFAVSFDQRWMVLARRTVWTGDEGWDSRVSVLMSDDGETWAASDPPHGWGSVTSLTAGPSSVIVTTCHFGGDSFWYSTDGVAWSQSSSGPVSHQSAYVDDLGFVTHSGNLWMVSPDGSEWQYPVDLGVTIEPFPKAGERLSAVEEIPFLYNNRLWIWSED